MTGWQPHRLREALLDDIAHRFADCGNPLDRIALQFDRARLLTELGRHEEAKNAYLAILNDAPDHFGALNNLGALLHAAGYRTAARTVYGRAAQIHPENALGHVNFANALLAEGELDLARTHFERALAISPDHAEAHRGFANLLMETGEVDKALEHRRRGYEGRAVSILPYRGAGEPVPVLMLVSAAGGNVPIERFLDDRMFLTTIIAAEYCDSALPLPAHRLIVNAIGDADLCYDALVAAAAIAARSDRPVINPPAAVLPTGRLDNARRFAGAHGIVAPAIVRIQKTGLLAGDAPEKLVALGFSFPFLLRAPGFHTGRHFVKVDRADDLAQAVSIMPGEEILVIQYLDSRARDGSIRKYRVMMISGQIYPLHVAISRDWKIHYFTADMADDAENRAEDGAFLNDMESVLGPKVMNALKHIQVTLGLDYAGVDFGVNSDGDLLLYEANATMVVNPPEPDSLWAYRRPAVDRIADAVRSMLCDSAKDAMSRRDGMLYA